MRAGWQNSQMPVHVAVFQPAEEPGSDIEDVVGSGPALWLWMDASAPSTTVQLQVLERIIRPGVRNAPRDFTWVVADAGHGLARLSAPVHTASDRGPLQAASNGCRLRWSIPEETSGGPGRLVSRPCLRSATTGPI